MRDSHRTLPAAALLLLSATFLSAQTAADASGHWEGAIQVPDHEVKIEVDLAKNGHGGLAGTFSNPAENVKGLPLSNVAAQEKSVRFLLKANSGGTFEGVLSADGQSISGIFTTTKGGFFVPFSLTRTGDPRIEPPAKSAPIGKELEGTWNAAFDVNGTPKRLVLTMSNQPDGTATGSIVSVDEGLEIPITTITQKSSSLTLDVKTVGASYSAALSAQGAELVGTWSQRSVALPLTFRRAAR